MNDFLYDSGQSLNDDPQECLTPRATLSFGAHQVRYCRRCAASKLHTDPFGDPLIRKDVESLGLSDSNVSETTIAVEYPSDGLQLGHRHGAYVWLKVDFEDFKDNYAEVRDDKIKMAHFREQRNKRYAEMVGHAREYGLWASTKQCKRSADINNIRETRFKSIKQKLIDEGWKREIDGLTSAQEILLRKLPSVRVARPLTHRMWPKVQLEIIPMLTQFRDARLAKKRATILRRRRQIFADVVDDYAATQSVRGIFPSAADLYVLEGFSAVKKRIEEDPNDVEYTPSAFDDILNQMPQYYEEWISLCTNKLLEVANLSPHIKNADPPVLLDKSSLALVTTIFCCRLCNGTVEYPNILVHECFRRPPRRTYFHLEVTQFIDGLDVLPWIEVPQNRIILLPPTFITEVGLSCGFGAQAMTHDELDSMNIWLAGEDDSEAQAVVRWRKAIQFDRWKQTTYSKTRYTWSRVTDESLIKTYNRFELDFYTKDFSGVLFCAHCLKNFEPTSFVYHMKQHKPDGGAIQMSDFIVDPTLAHQQLFSTSIPSEYRLGS
ncbi:hypothetical protein ONZ45_g14317 [Pleurotus djamor]|nr:hypothetical protein ONZ45_g14317 [Pleurotus djamor]